MKKNVIDHFSPFKFRLDPNNMFNMVLIKIICMNLLFVRLCVVYRGQKELVG